MIHTSPPSLSKEHLAIIKSVLYFDVFKYPLTLKELYENSQLTVSESEFRELIEHLCQRGVLQKKLDFILANGRNEADIKRRLDGNKAAAEIMPTAYKYTKKIASFPFVEGLCLSGGISKNYYDDKGDIDFFIITKPGRLWICRTLLILRFKLLPKNKKKFWCTNYFISSEDLVIHDRNLFTATELAYLIPVFNYTSYEQLIGANDWYKTCFPNKSRASNTSCIESPNRNMALLVEKILGGKFGQWVDNRLLFYTLKHWRKRYAELASEDFELQFRARKTVSKRHTKGFQNKVLAAWEEKKVSYEKMFGLLFA